MYQSGEDRAKSEFNMAIAYLNRLNSLLTFCNERAINLDVYNWFHGLLAIKRELNPQMLPTERTQTNQYVTQLTPAITLFSANNEGDNDVPPELYHQLHAFHEELIGVMDRTGILNKQMDDASRALR